MAARPIRPPGTPGPAPLPRQTAAREIVRVAREFHARGWCLGTSGNFSAVLSRDPLRLLVTRSGRDKSTMTVRDVLVVDELGDAAGRTVGRPSAETLLHCAIASETEAGSVLHVHSVPATLVGQRHLDRGGFTLRGYEMLKGFEGIETHEEELFVPVFANTQDIPALAREVRGLLRQRDDLRGFLIAGHGLYTWGRTVADARRHVEVFEFLLECESRGPASETGGSGGR